MEALLLVLGGVVGVIALLVYGSFVTGLLIYKFWYWFILPVFTSAPHLTLLQAIGIGIALTLIKTSSSFKKKFIDGVEIKEKEEWAAIIIHPWIILLIGWVWHMFI